MFITKRRLVRDVKDRDGTLSSICKASGAAWEQLLRTVLKDIYGVLLRTQHRERRQSYNFSQSSKQMVRWKVTGQIVLKWKRFAFIFYRYFWVYFRLIQRIRTLRGYAESSAWWTVRLNFCSLHLSRQPNTTLSHLQPMVLQCCQNTEENNYCNINLTK